MKKKIKDTIPLKLKKFGGILRKAKNGDEVDLNNGEDNHYDFTTNGNQFTPPYDPNQVNVQMPDYQQEQSGSITPGVDRMTDNSKYGKKKPSGKTGNEWVDFGRKLYGDVDLLAHDIPGKIGAINTNQFNRINEVNTDKIIQNPFLSSVPQRGTGQHLRKFGGKISDYKADGGNNMMPNVEVEGGEQIKLPNGMNQGIQGDSHAEGGIPMQLPAGTKIFSTKLKEPETNKSYSKLAKKFDTKKEQEILDDPKADKIMKETAKMQMDKKNQESDLLFRKMEMNKISGIHGKDVQEQTMQDYMPGMGQAENGAWIPSLETMELLERADNGKKTRIGNSIPSPGIHSYDYGDEYNGMAVRLMNLHEPSLEGDYQLSIDNQLAVNRGNNIGTSIPNPYNLESAIPGTENYGNIEINNRRNDSNSNSMYKKPTISNSEITPKTIATSSKKIVDNNKTGYKYGPNPQGGEKGPDYFNRHKYLYDDRVSHGYKGQPEIGQIQAWDVANHPDDVYNYMQGVRPNNKGLKIWEAMGKDHTPENFAWNKMEKKDVLNAYMDGLSDYRAPLISDKPAERIKVDNTDYTQKVSDPSNVETGKYSATKKHGLGMIPTIFGIPNPQLDAPVSFRHINPNPIDYRPENNLGEISEINSATAKLSRFLPTTAEGVADAANMAANASESINKSSGNLYNLNQRGKIQVDEANQRNLESVNQFNAKNDLEQLNHITGREQLKNVQSQTDRKEALNQINTNAQFYNTADFLGRTINPSDYYGGSADLFSEVGLGTNTSQAEKDKFKQYIRDYKGHVTGTKEETVTKRNGGKIKPSLNKMKLKHVKKSKV